LIRSENVPSVLGVRVRFFSVRAEGWKPAADPMKGVLEPIFFVFV